MVYCCVPYCKAKKGKIKGISFHEFPARLELRELWLKAVSRKDFIPNDRSPSSVICSQHFKDSDYVQTSKRKRLKRDAVPSKFDGYPHYMKKTSPVKRRKNKLEKAACSKVIEETTYVPPSNFETETSSEVYEIDKSVRTLQFKLKNVNTLLWKKNKLLKDIQRKYDEAREKLKRIEDSKFYVAAAKVYKDASVNKQKALLLHDLVINYSAVKPKYSEASMRECILLHHISPRGYMHSKKRLFNLPCRNTLKKYLGSSVTSIGVNNLIKERLTQEIDTLKEPYEKFSSLIIDEMAIQPKCQYDRGTDTVFGFTSREEKKVLANRLLCFVLSGLSTSYRIPCAYFFTKNLSGKLLFELTLEVIKEVEKCGFLIVRVVTDNHKSNVVLFKKLSQGSMKPSVPHPCDESRLLFLSFDPCHIIKNLRNQFLDKEMSGKYSFISGEYVKKVYELQKNETIKPVRFLTRKHVYPNNLEKMNVLRAVQIFSNPVIATIEFLKDNSFAHPKAHLFSESMDTIEYMKNIQKWFNIHDVSNRTLGVHSKNSDKEQFLKITDERLNWLDKDFPAYLQEVKDESKKCQKDFISNETYQALTLTTLSTVECVKYLLNNGFYYVLTRKFSSDPVESLFSSIRAMNGGNDASDAKASTFAINKILQTGLLLHSDASNVQVNTIFFKYCNMLDKDIQHFMI